MRKFLLACTVLCLTAMAAWAQRTIKGKVRDESGSPLPGTTVHVKGTTTGTATNADGAYTLPVGPNAHTLVFSSIGMATQEVTIGTQTTIDVSLKPSQQSITEVVITGYNNVRRSQFSGATTPISGKLVESVPVGSFDQALQGRAPGLLVNSSSGQPGSAAAVTIRGVQSLSGSGAQPLYIVDGIPLNAADFQTINPNDFETINVLKDASAAALYGARAGTGVIVITTKRGKAGQPKFTFRTQMGVSLKPTLSNFDLMNTADILEYERRNKIANTPGWVWSPDNPASASNPRAAQLLDSIRAIDTDYRDYLLRDGFSQNYEINASGGNEKTRYFFSGGYFDQDGIDLTSALTRYTTRFNLDHTMNNFSLSFNNAIGYSLSALSESEYLANSARNGFQMSWRTKPYERVYAADGSLNAGTSSLANGYRQVANVIEGVEATTFDLRQFKINSGLTLSYRILPYLTARNVIGIDASFESAQRAVAPLSLYGKTFPEQKGIDIESNRLYGQLINTSSLVFNEKFGRHDLEVGGYFEVVRVWMRGNSFYLYNLDPRLLETGQAAGNIPIVAGQENYPQVGNSAKTGYGIRSYFGSLRYTYNDRYTLNATVRRDGTSRILNEANNQITTWSAGVTWDVLKENFLKSQDFVTDLRFRASYGATPNIGSISTGLYTMHNALASPNSRGMLPVTNFMISQYDAFAATSFNGSKIGGFVPNALANPNLKIETIRKTNIGFDLGVWENRARLGVDVYKNKTVDLFVRKNLPAHAGISTIDINAGVMTNKGIEFSLNVDAVKKKDLEVTLGVNHAYNKNEIEDLGGEPEYVSGTFIIREGLAFGSHYTYHYLGADPQTGRPMYEALDGKTVYDVAAAGQFAKFGTYFPKHIGGITLDVRYKRFSLNTLFSYQFDVVRSNNIENWVTRGTAGYHASVNGVKRLLTEQWQKPGDEKLYQAFQYDRGFTSSDLQDAKFLRWRNLQIAYNIPAPVFKGAKIFQSARLYVQGQNLIVWSPWRGPDPEDANNISLNEYPNPKNFVAGIDINF
ncbi:SusC/RagA family TonB-linked outer membrane protein [Chitinophaga lutea]